MNTKHSILLHCFMVLLIASCGSKKEDNAALTDKKVALEKLKAENAKKAEEIKKLQAEIALKDTNAANATKVKLVGTTVVALENFNHYVDLQGMVDAENISYISPRGMGGQVKAIYVREGQFVKKGQLVLKLDNAIISQQVTATRQQLDGIKTQLAFAKNIYNRQKNLWEQGIGTEVQLLTAKTNVEALENQLTAAGEGVKVAVEQQKTANVYSDVSGIVDQVNIKIGETFMGMGAMGPQIKVVNTSALKVVTSIPENYIGRLRTGTPAEVSIPDLNKVFNASVSLISQSVDQNRGFTADIKIPYDARVKPNQTAKVRLLDYSAANAVVIPVNVLQSDEAGKYLYVVDKLSNGKTVAKKVTVNIGEVYGERVEIKTGLRGGEQLITEGYQSIYEGQAVSTSIN
jgi:membrane fusion protein, multidrug efflux system